MTAEHDNHGQTPAAWTAVIIMILAFLVGGLGLVFSQTWMFWAGVALFFIGPVVGKVMAMAGLGKAPRATEHPAETAAESVPTAGDA